MQSGAILDRNGQPLVFKKVRVGAGANDNRYDLEKYVLASTSSGRQLLIALP
jgi:hypothetical protein